MVCRLCLIEHENNIAIFSDKKIAEYITKFLQLKLTPEDSVSKVVCELCWRELKNFANFYQRISETQRGLSAMVGVSMVVIQNDNNTIVKETFNTEKYMNPALDSVNKQKPDNPTNDKTIVVVDPFNYYEIVELNKEEVTESSNIAQPSITTVRRRRKRHASTLKNISNGEKRKCLRLTTRDITTDKLDKIGEDKEGNVSNGSDSLSGKDRLPIKKGRTGRSAKLWEKSEEFDKIIKDTMKLFCDICAANLSDFRELQRHFRHIHKLKGYVVCCNRRLYKRGLLVDHISTHHGEKYNCKICGKRAPSMNILQRHKVNCAKRIASIKATDESYFRKAISERSAKLWEKSKQFDKIIKENIQLWCAICGINLENFRELQRHFRSIHRTKGYAVCCNKQIFKRGLLINHINAKHRRREYSCEAKQAILLNNLQKHQPLSPDGIASLGTKCMKNLVETVEATVELVECNTENAADVKSSPLRSVEQSTMPNIVIKVEEEEIPAEAEEGIVKRKRGRPRNVTKIPRKVKSERSIKIWERSKEFDKIIKRNMELICDICSVAMTDFADLQRHFRRVHEEKGYVVCCNNRFYKRRCIVDHIRAHKGIFKAVEKRPNVRRFRSEISKKVWEDTKRSDEIIQKNMNLFCDICNVNLGDFGEAKRHYLHIHKEKGYVVCSNCRLYKRSSIVDHITLHEEKTYTCDLCGMGDFSEAALEEHKDTCSNESETFDSISAIKPSRKLSV